MDKSKKTVGVIDKSKWLRGVWDAEPDRVEWTYRGMPCLIVRVQTHGGLCGYVAVPPGHPAHGKGYDDVAVDIHGGLTYARGCGGHVCHVPAEGESDDVWWLGFDCAHCDDLCPAMPTGIDDQVYRDVAYVRAEVESLADQLAAMGGV